MEKESWRKTILDAVLDEGEVSADSLHEAGEGEDDVQQALDTADQLVRDGLLAEDHGVYTVAPGQEGAVRAAQAAY